MNDLPATLTALGTLVAAVGALYLSFRNSKKADDARDKAIAAAMQAAQAKAEAEDAKGAIVKVGDDLFRVGKQIDGRLSELLELTARASRAEGLEAGRISEKARRDAENGKPKDKA